MLRIFQEGCGGGGVDMESREGEFPGMECLCGQDESFPVFGGEGAGCEAQEDRVVDSVEFISHDGESEGAERGSDLVCSSGMESGFQECEGSGGIWEEVWWRAVFWWGEAIGSADGEIGLCGGGLGVFGEFHQIGIAVIEDGPEALFLFHGGVRVFHEPSVGEEGLPGGASMDHAEILLVCLDAQGMQEFRGRCGKARVLSHQDDAGGLAVQSVDEVDSLLALRLSEPRPEGVVEEASGGVAGEISGLVDQEEVVGFLEDMHIEGDILLREIPRLKEESFSASERRLVRSDHAVQKEIPAGDLALPLRAVQIVVAAFQKIQKAVPRLLGGNLDLDGPLHRKKGEKHCFNEE